MATEEKGKEKEKRRGKRIKVKLKKAMALKLRRIGPNQNHLFNLPNRSISFSSICFLSSSFVSIYLFLFEFFFLFLFFFFLVLVPFLNQIDKKNSSQTIEFFIQIPFLSSFLPLHGWIPSPANLIHTFHLLNQFFSSRFWHHPILLTISYLSI